MGHCSAVETAIVGKQVRFYVGLSREMWTEKNTHMAQFLSSLLLSSASHAPSLFSHSLQPVWNHLYSFEAPSHMIVSTSLSPSCSLHCISSSRFLSYPTQGSLPFLPPPVPSSSILWFTFSLSLEVSSSPSQISLKKSNFNPNLFYHHLQYSYYLLTFLKSAILKSDLYFFHLFSTHPIL